MKNKKRALRRQHKQNKKNKALKVAKETWHLAVPEYVIKDVDHMASCSCWVCGNPRKYFKKLTLQEKRAILSENDE